MLRGLILLLLVACQTRPPAQNPIEVIDSVPERVEPTADVPLNLVVSITNKGFRIRAAGYDDVDLPCAVEGCVMDPTDIESVRRTYDFKGLHERAIQLSNEHPKERNVVLASEPDVAYVVLVEAMDTLREDPTSPQGSDSSCNGRCLFPFVVVAGGVPE